MHSIDHVVLLKKLSDRSAIWNLHYKFNPPISNRTFTVLQVIHLDTSGERKSGYVIFSRKMAKADSLNDQSFSIIVSIPVDVSGDAEMSQAELKGARGRYVAVERIQELENGKTEWRSVSMFCSRTSMMKTIYVRMATSSTPGGSIPSFVAQASIPGTVTNDVPLFLKWYNSDKEYFKKGVAKETPAAESPMST